MTNNYRYLSCAHAIRVVCRYLSCLFERLQQISAKAERRLLGLLIELWFCFGFGRTNRVNTGRQRLGEHEKKYKIAKHVFLE